MSLSAGEHRLTLLPFALSDTVVLDPPLKAIDIMAEGDLKIQDIEGNDQVYVFPVAAAGGAYPFRLHLLIQKVYDTGTDIPIAGLIGLH